MVIMYLVVDVIYVDNFIGDFYTTGIVMTYCHPSLKKGLTNISCQICLLILLIDFQQKSPSAKYLSHRQVH
jgi:hypothetical protein